jgi:hypothetical protein
LPQILIITTAISHISNHKHDSIQGRSLISQCRIAGRAVSTAHIRSLAKLAFITKFQHLTFLE